jgi:NADH:ubiquinone reductase (non-electrogenic)
MAKLPTEQTNRRGITVDDGLRTKGAKDISAIGDCTATSYAPTAQVASQQGAYLARVLHQLAKKDGLEKELKKLEGLDEERARVRKEIAVMKSKISKIQPKPFDYSHQDTLAYVLSFFLSCPVLVFPASADNNTFCRYISSEKAITDLPFMNRNIASGDVATYLFWRSAYLSTLFSLRNRTLVAADWVKVKLFGQ